MLESNLGLMLENISPLSKSVFNQFNTSVDFLDQALSAEELKEYFDQKKYQILGVRSKTLLDAETIDNLPSLKVIGSYCIGTDKIDAKYASQKGVAMFNAPYSNSRSVVELTIAEIILLMRKAHIRNIEMHQGNWQKTAKDSFEVRGKTLGIIGYGNIGSQVSTLAEALGMRVIYYDALQKPTLGNNRCVSLPELLATSDAITLHLDGRPENINWFDKSKMQMVKKGAILINLSRGSIINDDDLLEALDQGIFSSVGIDVYKEEPKANGEIKDNPFVGNPKVFLTPHIGGATQEAQRDIAEFVSNQIVNYLKFGDTSLSVNLPRVSPNRVFSYRFIHLHTNTAGILAQINQILGEAGINIEGQQLQTKDELGYVVTDINKDLDQTTLDKLQSIEQTIFCRKISAFN